jgi:Tfp pilus assembly protein PilE
MKPQYSVADLSVPVLALISLPHYLRHHQKSQRTYGTKRLQQITERFRELAKGGVDSLDDFYAYPSTQFNKYMAIINENKLPQAIAYAREWYKELREEYITRLRT